MTYLSLDAVIYEVAKEALNYGTEEKKTNALLTIMDLISTKSSRHKEFFRDEYGRIYRMMEG